MNDVTCNTCLYWKRPTGDNVFGNCHRYPPIYIPHGDHLGIEFPPTEKSDWCGEYHGTNYPTQDFPS